MVSSQGNTRVRFSALADTPSASACDRLNIQPFIEGLATFIRNCETPMTIAVQGEWGTGKTNTMLLTEDQLTPDAHFRLSDPPSVREGSPHEGEVPRGGIYTVRFNTWQYSQFELGDRLVGSLLESIGAHLMLANPRGARADKRQAFLQSLLPVASTAGLSVLKSALSLTGLGPISGAIEEVKDAYLGARSSDSRRRAEDAAAALVDVKAKFSDAVAELIASDDGGRLVVFIDDLDRLEPRKAIELLEALKLFLDVPHCVFVLAIDFSVVNQGVIAKYGTSMGQTKARAFFDKIIQVPFQMPVGVYAINSFFTDLIESTGMQLTPQECERIIPLVRTSVGSNPRAIKRLINTALLLRSIADIQSADADGRTTNLELFAVLCLQTAYPDAYAEILKRDIVDSRLYEHYFAMDSHDRLDVRDPALMLELTQGSIVDTAHFADLARTVREAFTSDEDGPAGGGFDYERFAAALSQAVTTSSGTAAQENVGPRGGKTYAAADRRTRILEEFSWTPSDLEERLRLPERFADGLENLKEVSIGAESANATRWVIELFGKRIGQILIHQKFFHITFEPRWFVGDGNEDFFYDRFRAELPEIEQSRIEAYEGDGWFRINRLGRDELALVDRIVVFWADMLREEITRRASTETRRG